MKYLLFILMLLFFCSCKSDPPQSLCIMEPMSDTCWIDKDDHLGTSIEDMHGYYCVDKDDFKKLTTRLVEAKNITSP